MESRPVLQFPLRQAARKAGINPSLPVISGGKDALLLQLREKLMVYAGIRVQSLAPEEALNEAHVAEARIWIFCSTIGPEEVLNLASSIRRYSPESKLLLLEGMRPVFSQKALVHRVLSATCGVEQLLSAVHELLEPE